MTVNAFNPNSSSPVAGLGTFLTNIVTAGRYDLSVQSTLPYNTPGNPGDSAESYESTDITAVADVAGSLASTYFTFSNAGDANLYYAWYKVSGTGTDPAVAGRTGIEVDIATNDTADTVASATRTAIAAAVTQITVTGATSHVILTNKQLGQNTDAANGTASPGFSYSVTQGSSDNDSQLIIQIKKNSTVLATVGPPNAYQKVAGASVSVNCSAGDTLSVVLSSLAAVDNLPNAVKSIINCNLF